MGYLWGASGEATLSILYVAQTGTPVIVTLCAGVWDMGKKIQRCTIYCKPTFTSDDFILGITFKATNFHDQALSKPL